MTASPINPDEPRRPPGTPATRCSPSKKPAPTSAIPEGTLRYWRHLGAGPRSFKIGRHVRYWRTDLILWLTEQTNRPQDHR